MISFNYVQSVCISGHCRGENKSLASNHATIGCCKFPQYITSFVVYTALAIKSHFGDPTLHFTTLYTRQIWTIKKRKTRLIFDLFTGNSQGPCHADNCNLMLSAVNWDLNISYSHLHSQPCKNPNPASSHSLQMRTWLRSPKQTKNVYL